MSETRSTNRPRGLLGIFQNTQKALGTRLKFVGTQTPDAPYIRELAIRSSLRVVHLDKGL